MSGFEKIKKGDKMWIVNSILIFLIIIGGFLIYGRKLAEKNKMTK